VFSLSSPARALIPVLIFSCSACTGMPREVDRPAQPQTFYTVTAEIALQRQERRLAALQYAAAVQHESDPQLLKRADEVASATLQPTIAASIAERWVHVEPRSLEAQRAAGQAALALHRIEPAAQHYQLLLANTPGGVDGAFAAVEIDLGESGNVFGARQLADRLAAAFPGSAAVLQAQGVAALRADDPAAAVRALGAALALQRGGDDAAQAARRELSQLLSRARVMAGDADLPLQEEQARVAQDASPENRFEYAVLLMAAQRDSQAVEQLELLSRDAQSRAAALRLLGVVEYQRGHLETAAAHFQRLLQTGKLMDDGYYYLGLIADRADDPDRALGLYAQVQHGDNVTAALLRAAAILYKHGAAPAAEELLDRMVNDEPERAPEILTARARIYADSGSMEQALDVLDRAVSEYPDSVELRYARVSVYEEQGHINAALKDLKDVLVQRPDDPAALNALGFTLADHDRSLGRARRLIERAYACAPRNYAILDSMGWVLFREGHAAQALPYLESAYAGDRGGDIAAHLGEVLWHSGRAEEARQLFTEAALFDADNRLLKSTRQRLEAGH
jgi:tetratricopeptide (TPR) repeat protein